MTSFKTILTPRLIDSSLGYIKNEDTFAALQDYALIGNIQLDTEYSEVYLKNISFIVAFPTHGNLSAKVEMFTPYQVHIKWLDGNVVNFQPGKIVANTTAILNGAIHPTPLLSSEQPDYSTFCIPEMISATTERTFQDQNQTVNIYHGDTDWLFYSLNRDALLKRGTIRSMFFELYFTSLDGMRMYNRIPNVEIEFALY